MSLLDRIILFTAAMYTFWFVNALVRAWREAYDDGGNVGNRPQPSKNGFSWSDGPDEL